MPVQIFCFKLCSILLNDEKTLDSFILPSYLRYKKGLDLNLQPRPPPPHYTICSYAPDEKYLWRSSVSNIAGF